MQVRSRGGQVEGGKRRGRGEGDTGWEGRGGGVLMCNGVGNGGGGYLGAWGLEEGVDWGSDGYCGGWDGLVACVRW